MCHSQGDFVPNYLCVPSCIYFMWWNSRPPIVCNWCRHCNASYSLGKIFDESPSSITTNWCHNHIEFGLQSKLICKILNVIHCWFDCSFWMWITLSISGSIECNQVDAKVIEQLLSRRRNSRKKILIKESQRENKKLSCYSPELLFLWFADSAKPLKTHPEVQRKKLLPKEETSETSSSKSERQREAEIHKTSRSPKKNNPTKEETVEKTFNKESETKRRSSIFMHLT